MIRRTGEIISTHSPHERLSCWCPLTNSRSAVYLDLRAVVPSESQLCRPGHTWRSPRSCNHTQYGFNISALNSLSSAISCIGIQSPSWLPSCFPLTATRFGLLSSILTIGGLLGSLGAGTIADKKGRRAACIVGASNIAIGGALMALAPYFTALLMGRCVQRNRYQTRDRSYI